MKTGKTNTVSVLSRTDHLVKTYYTNTVHVFSSTDQSVKTCAIPTQSIVE